MPHALEIVSLSARTATVLCTPADTRYHLADALDWRLTAADGRAVASGRTKIAPVFIEDLTPATDYVFSCPLGEIALRTDDCAGAVSVADFGADPDLPDNAPAFQRAIQAVPEGGTLIVPPGRFQVRPIFLKAQMTLYLPEQAEIFAAHDRNHWPVLPPRDANARVLGTWEGVPEASFAAPVTAIDCDGLTITGRGRIDAGGDRGDWWSWPKETRSGARRPRALFLAHGSGVELSGFTLCNSPSWTLHPFRIDGLTCAALHIENPPDSPNTDGLDPESCTDIDLVGLHFSVGDDCIAVKACKRAPGQIDHIAPTRDLLVRHCLMARGHGAVVLGSEMSGEITGVTVRHCEFQGTDRGLRIKTRRGRGGRVADVKMHDVDMSDVGTALAINAFYFCDPDGRSEAVQSRTPAPVDETTPSIHDIRLENVTARGVQVAGVALLGLPEAPVTDVYLSGVRMSFAQDAAEAVPLMAAQVPAMRATPLWAEYAEVHGEVETLDPEEEQA